MSKKSVWITIGSMIYAIVVYILSIVFFLHRNWAPGNPEEYQTELDFMMQELGNGNVIAYGMLLLQLSVLVLIVYGVWKIIQLFSKKRQKN